MTTIWVVLKSSSPMFVCQPTHSGRSKKCNSHQISLTWREDDGGGGREWLAGREKVQAINIEKILAHVRKRLFAELWWWGRELRMVHKSDISLQLPSSFGGQKEIYETPCQRNGFFLLNPPEIMSTWSFEGLSPAPRVRLSMSFSGLHLVHSPQHWSPKGSLMNRPENSVFCEPPPPDRAT